MVNKSLYIAFYILVGFALLFHLKQVRFFFDLKTQYYSHYNQLPSPWNAFIQEYKEEAKKYKVDISELDSLNFVILKDPELSFSGYYDLVTHTVFINEYPQRFNFVNKRNLWHELGHGVLNYGHDTSVELNNLMHPKISVSLDSNWEIEKNLYFTQKRNRNIVKNYFYNLFEMNWYAQEIKTAFTQH